MKKERFSRQCKIQRIIRDCYEQLYGNKIDNLEEMRVLEKFNLPLNQEEIEVMNNSIEIIEIEAVIKNFP